MTFSEQYPYLSYWVESHGSLQLGTSDYHDDFVTLTDEGGVVWSGEADESVEQALQEAEHHLRTVVAPDVFDEADIDEIEADYAQRKD